jgi:hypothetical protein
MMNLGGRDGKGIERRGGIPANARLWEIRFRAMRWKKLVFEKSSLHSNQFTGNVLPPAAKVYGQ